MGWGCTGGVLLPQGRQRRGSSPLLLSAELGEVSVLFPAPSYFNLGIRPIPMGQPALLTGMSGPGLRSVAPWKACVQRWYVNPPFGEAIPPALPLLNIWVWRASFPASLCGSARQENSLAVKVSQVL